MSVLRAGIETLQTHTFNAKCVLRGTTLPMLVLQAAHNARTECTKAQRLRQFAQIALQEEQRMVQTRICAENAFREDTKMSKAQVKVAKTVQQDLRPFQSAMLKALPQVTAQFVRRGTMN